MTQFNKNGVILAGGVNEASAFNIISDSVSYSYTPSTGLNSCSDNLTCTGIEKNKNYYVEVLVTWKNFDTSNTSGTFDAFFQGSQHDSQGWGWRHANPMSHALQTTQPLKPLVLSATTGSKTIKTTFNSGAYCDGFVLGCRFDYSNGKGWIKLSNIKLIPFEHAICKGVETRIFNNEILSQEIIEY